MQSLIEQFVFFFSTLSVNFRSLYLVSALFEVVCEPVTMVDPRPMSTDTHTLTHTHTMNIVELFHH